MIVRMINRSVYKLFDPEFPIDLIRMIAHWKGPCFSFSDSYPADKFDRENAFKILMDKFICHVNDQLPMSTLYLLLVYEQKTIYDMIIYEQNVIM